MNSALLVNEHAGLSGLRCSFTSSRAASSLSLPLQDTRDTARALACGCKKSLLSLALLYSFCGQSEHGQLVEETREESASQSWLRHGHGCTAEL